MANHKSALKRHRQSEKKRLHYKSIRSRISTLTKTLQAATKKDDAQAKLKEVVSALHKACQKNIFHRNTANRRISKLAKAVNQIK